MEEVDIIVSEKLSNGEKIALLKGCGYGDEEIFELILMYSEDAKEVCHGKT